ncbi:hypothetical protein ACFSCX_12495 [Bacillus salitolerans]|uniref:Uncharacterized protein n=1 Tax=Bacillus salitolerans TaxID=1437434 RepID=A0ABW4LQC5_9BACI
MKIDGIIISGEFDELNNEFYLQRVKYHNTASILKKTQWSYLYHYLKGHSDNKDGQIITLYDQMLIPLSQEEIRQFIDDLETLEPKYH